MKAYRLLILALSTVVVVGASAAPAAAAIPGQGLEISPPLVERSVDPGQTVQVEIRIRNVTTSTIVTAGSVQDFTAGDETGQPKLLLDDNGAASKEKSPYTLKDWVQPIPSLQLSPQEAKTAVITLNVPQNASPGGHYGVVRFTASSPDLQDSGVALSASIGSLLLLNVSGDVKTSAKVEEFSAIQNGSKGTFFEKGPILYSVRIKNTGNVHVKPTGTIRITNTFGKEEAVLTVNPNGGNVLPQSIRRFDQTFEKKSLFGRYKAELNVQYNGKNLSQTLVIWVIPYKLILIALAGLALLIFLLKKGIARYNAYIIKKSSSQKKK